VIFNLQNKNSKQKKRGGQLVLASKGECELAKPFQKNVRRHHKASSQGAGGAPPALYVASWGERPPWQERERSDRCLTNIESRGLRSRSGASPGTLKLGRGNNLQKHQQRSTFVRRWTAAGQPGGHLSFRGKIVVSLVSQMAGQRLQAFSVLFFFCGHHGNGYLSGDAWSWPLGTPQGVYISFSLLIMDDKQETIGLTALLDDISNDLNELRKKHSSDYNIKNITMWWELERERVVSRHNPGMVVKKLRRIQSAKRLMAWFFAGWIVMLAVNTTVRLFFP
jgi:hypothetical protein